MALARPFVWVSTVEGLIKCVIFQRYNGSSQLRRQDYSHLSFATCPPACRKGFMLAVWSLGWAGMLPGSLGRKIPPRPSILPPDSGVNESSGQIRFAGTAQRTAPLHQCTTAPLHQSNTTPLHHWVIFFLNLSPSKINV